MRFQAIHHSWLVASGQPFLLWICGLEFLFSLVVKPLLQWIIPDMESPATDIMRELTLTMLVPDRSSNHRKTTGVCHIKKGI